MTKYIFSIAIISFAFLITSCGDDEEQIIPTDYAYHAHINSPSADDKNVDDMIDINLEFESHAGEPVHHINVRIYNVSDSTEVYNQPTEAHIHAVDGIYEYEDTFQLSNANGVEAHSDWILEAKVWGENATEGEEIETIQFHVHP